MTDLIAVRTVFTTAAPAPDDAIPRTAAPSNGPAAAPRNPVEKAVAVVRLRYDRVDNDGHVSLRHAGRMHHLGIGRAHKSKRILALADSTTVTVIHLDTGEIIATNAIDPDRNYWRNTQKAPGRWPGAS